MSKDNSLFSDFPPAKKSDWENVIKKDLNGENYKEKLRWDTLEGFEALPVYTSDDISTYNPVQKEGRGWISCLPADETDPESAADKIKQEAEMNKAFCFGIQISENEGMLGGDRSGLEIKKQEDFNNLADAIKSSKQKVIFDAPEATPVIAAMATNSKLNSGQIMLLYDPLTEIVKHGRLPVPEERLRILVNEMAGSGFRSLAANGAFYQNAGATIVQETGIMLAIASEYLASVDVDNREAAASALWFRTAVGPLFFPEIAKLRAVRLLWTRLMEAYGIENSDPPVLFSETTFYNKSRSDSYNNMVRSVNEAMSAVIGGADLLMVHPHNKSFEEPTEFSKRMAANIHPILREEAHLGKVHDPAAGSYYIEILTDEIAEKSWELFRQIEMEGGFLKAVQNGTIQDRIQDGSKQKQKAYQKRKRVLVGTNNYPNIGEELPSKMTSKKQMKTLETGEFEFDGDQPGITLSQIADALQNGALTGDVMGACYQPQKVKINTLQKVSVAEIFDSLREKTEATKADGKEIRALLVPVGSLAWRSARATFSHNFLGCAGFTIRQADGFNTINEAIEQLKNPNAEIIVLCGSDKEYPEIAGTFAENFGKESLLVLAGNPGDNESHYRELGFEFFIHMKSNLAETLANIQKEIVREEI